jgi:hypothetical protein
MQAERGAARPAFYALAPGGWRDYVSLLHPPYTAWHLSYVAIGAAVSSSFDASRLVAALAAFGLAVGVAAHALDELHDRPLQTRVPANVLRLLAGTSLAGAAAIGVVGVSTIGWSFLPWVALGVALVLAYNLEWGGRTVHNGLGFALAWGAFPVLASAASQGGIDLAVAGAAVFATLTSLAQRTLSNEVRAVRRRSVSVQGEIGWRDGTRTPLDAAALTRPEERALMLLAAAHVLLALVLVGLAS